MRVFHLVLTLVATLMVVSSSVTATAKEIGATDDTVISDHVGTRDLTGVDGESEERASGGRGGGGRGGGRGTSRGTSGGGNVGPVYTTHTSIGLMNTNRITSREKKCNRFTNWLRRLFDKSIPKCPKKKKSKKKDTRRLRTN
ncbi:hypothetical protein PHMEG_00010588 [Phytophthora megakarya]|uniref:RxLR effector protein n=1 Tax=Phytophthora megakarya TaxID=4795 RepID=A0A225WEP6_9STRA|nr:hypothetical protein PHMEG_00010588 [Phytophthora megakarya]